ncbi:hypothetical protein PRIPAC_80732 [Pristionchus pacificus]|uniref:Uncharacterized protein n=1 Tax=Pristionchus pacificus TaxID=54126 RepID=A0A2A6BX27_PRIPA|nr:hypothetical protein PRIPAC_80732 [Pristionchus pacificus]|eukprot:PDM70323.1 hypothetical protein PRIPAC_46569 [Pristionchus pacificus]
MVDIFMPPGRIVLVRGKYAGRKALVVESYDGGASDRSYAHALVIGIDRHPRKATKSMGKKKQTERNKLKPFIKTSVNKEALNEPKKKKRALHEVKARLEEKHKTGKDKWFFIQ